MQLTPQSVDKLQNAAGLGFHNRFHDQLATAVQDRDHDRFLVHVHADILDVATHSVASLGERSLVIQRSLSLKVKCHGSQNLPTFIAIPMYYSPLNPSLGFPTRAALVEPSPAQRSGDGASPSALTF